MQIWHVAETGSIGYVTLQEWKMETVVVKQKKKKQLLANSSGNGNLTGISGKKLTVETVSCCLRAN